MDHSICLNMIVKDEAHVIKSTLENICNNIPITYYVISDTGSSDDTIQIINDFFEEKNIKGEIHNDEWKDFGYNRTLALKHAYKKTKYLFIFDADDRINGDFKFNINLNNEIDAYFFKFGDSFKYKRILLINNHLEWVFVGVLHEYLKCNSKEIFSNTIIEGNYFIDSGKTGNRSIDPKKYHKDAIILENAYYQAEKNNDPIKVRYSFYCAQSYKDSEQDLKAIEWYLKRVNLKEWDQEIYYSFLTIGRLYIKLKEFEKAIFYWSLSLDVDKERYECIYEIISFFRQTGKYYLAYNYYLMIDKKNINLDNKLFVFSPIYYYLLDYEMSIIFYHIQKYNEGINFYRKLFCIIDIDLNLSINIINNFVFYLDYLTYDLNLIESYFNFIQNMYLRGLKLNEENILNINKTIIYFEKLYNNESSLISKKINKGRENVKVMLSITTCKRYDLFSRTINSFLSCCLDIDKIDLFFCVDDNSDKADREKMIRNYPFFKYYFKSNKEKGHLNSMNIIWNKLNTVKPKYWIHLEDDWLFIKPCKYIEKSISFLEKYENKGIHQILFNKNYAEIVSDYHLVGGKPLQKGKYLLHIKDEPDLIGFNSAYWPHYSFRPSMCLVDTILKLGDYNSSNTFFERDYADKYFGKGYRSGFYNEISCIHIGKLTGNRLINSEKNAYELNEVSQFIDEYIYLKGLDYYDNDLEFKPNISVDDMRKNVTMNESCIAFNSLGYFKHSIDLTKLMKFSDDNNGLYINVNRYNKKYNCSIKDILSNKKKYLFIKNYDYINNNVNCETQLKYDDISNLFENDLNIDAIMTNGYIINNIDFNNLIRKDNCGIYININKLTEDNCYLKLKNINSLDKDYIVDLKNDFKSDFKNVLSDYTNEYVAYNSNGFYKKNIDFNNLVDVAEIYENWICINLKKIQID